jgi:hypothetical protein
MVLSLLEQQLAAVVLLQAVDEECHAGCAVRVQSAKGNTFNH